MNMKLYITNVSVHHYRNKNKTRKTLFFHRPTKKKDKKRKEKKKKNHELVLCWKERKLDLTIVFHPEGDEEGKTKTEQGQSYLLPVEKPCICQSNQQPLDCPCEELLHQLHCIGSMTLSPTLGHPFSFQDHPQPIHTHFQNHSQTKHT